MPELRGLLVTLTSVLLEVLVEPASDRLLMGGTANLTERALDFPAIRPVLEALEEQVVLLRLLDQSVATSEVLVRIGNETLHEGLATTAVVTSGYGVRGSRAGRCRRARPAADGLRAHDGPGGGRGPLRRHVARKSADRTLRLALLDSECQ